MGYGALNGLGMLCLGMCLWSFTTIFARTERRVQRTLLFRPFFFSGFYCSLDRGGGGAINDLSASRFVIAVD